ncbi:MAG: hypothetical protein LAP87_12860 [Acidobacteriia bacterium]|nr:hypothetical protein [Terriglobia bacterium]
MKVTFAVITLLIASTVAATAVIAQSANCVRCSDAETLVTTVMAAPTVFDLSFHEHRGRILGDRVAIAIANQLRLSDLRDPEKAKRVLLLLRYAFSEPEFIQTKEDKKPGVTLMLLDLLAEEAPDAGARQTARELASKVRASR